MDFTFNNTKINAYFLGDNTNPPVSELVYLHTHPLVRPNFLNELEDLVIKTEQHIHSKRITGYPIEALGQVAISIGTKMPTFSEESAPLILEELRKLYVVCNQIIEMQ